MKTSLNIVGRAKKKVQMRITNMTSQFIINIIDILSQLFSQNQLSGNDK